MDKKNNISERIKELVDTYANGNNVHFAKMIGTSEANVRNYINGIQPKFEILAAIKEKLEINAEWLLTGRGEKTVKNDSEPPKEKDTPASEPVNLDIVDRLLLAISQKDKKIEEQAETIGKLRQEVSQLKQTTPSVARDAEDAVCADVG